MKTINIIAVDDHQIVLDGISYSISKKENTEIIGTYNTKQDFLEALAKEHQLIDIAIVDLNLNEKAEDMLELPKTIKKLYPEIKILILTSYSGNKLMHLLKDIHVDGYLSKTHTRSELFEAIDQVCMNQKYFQNTSEVNQIIDDNFSVSLEYSEREKEILQLLAKGKTDISIGETLFLSANTIKTHRQNLRKKMNVSTTAEMIAIAAKQNII
jgi:DNA-binding NarL/FixJ family response regulator